MSLLLDARQRTSQGKASFTARLLDLEAARAAGTFLLVSACLLPVTSAWAEAPLSATAPPVATAHPVDTAPAIAISTRSSTKLRPTPAPKTPAPRIVARAAAGSALENAYEALVDGRLDSAAEGYRRALAHNGEERDALLGLGHIAHRQGRREEARAYYERVLRQEPENAVANAGMLALQAEGDPSTAASRAREMAERNPDSAAAFATLGGALVREGKLADAQQAFFRAAALEPANAAHAYNLAVALDRLHKPELAANYYAKALALGERSGAAPGFPRDIARQRLEQLRAAPSRN